MSTHKSQGDREDFGRFCHPGTRCASDWYKINDRVTLLVTSFYPPDPSANPPIVMVPGLATVIEGFREALTVLTREYTVHYVETREKRSSRLTGRVPFDVGSFGADIAALVKLLNLEPGKFCLFGYSLGATAIVDAYRDLPAKPGWIVLLEPNATFDYPKLALAVMKLNLPLLYVLKPLVKWYIRQFRINRKEDYEMYRISARALDSAHPVRLRKTALAISSYSIWDRLADPDCPVLIVGSSKDRFHNHGETLRMVDGIRNCTYIDLENNRRSHSSELADAIRRFLAG